MSEPSAELESTLRKLSIGGKGPVQDIPRPNVKKFQTAAVTLNHKANSKIHRKPVADSWEDEADLSAPESEEAQPHDEDAAPVLSPTISAEGPLDPPPTPISPQTSNPWMARSASPASAKGPPTRRPEKQTAVAERLIAGALGIRAPKRTEQQRAYDRSVKEQEIRRRNREREEKAKAKEEEERMKASIWNN
ncbi:alcohol dehydrogenase [Penicillium digitatum]|uniref:Uncharacterized protein n=3 Tax=Penicillium digitatum TaxID=36651 RepID=K9FA97_PEND2|nr:hypothetical protein PDIP_27330 [Penicillium digitatum Pd1]EKV06114.1 hypothetical protein PDIG_78920 [Penicillium digitatum PHI26]EKV18356.1 hypothetical protein PDIP_27330 [Penicillium digitatum Pd1]QQK47169.1 alcohol dehydrogenase [Penicillium digitatum]